MFFSFLFCIKSDSSIELNYVSKKSNCNLYNVLLRFHYTAAHINSIAHNIQKPKNKYKSEKSLIFSSKRRGIFLSSSISNIHLIYKSKENVRIYIEQQQLRNK